MSVDHYQKISYGIPVTLAAGAAIIQATTTTGEFTNQPSNDGVEIGSDNAADTMNCTIWGTTTGTDTVVAETVTLTGVTFVSTSKTDWGDILGAEISANGSGTITIREASGNASITTIDSTSATTSGIEEVAVASQLVQVTPIAVNDQAGTQVIGLIGEDPGYAAAPAAVLDAQALNGTTNVLMNKPFYKVTRILVGDLASGDTVSFTGETAQNCGSADNHCIGLHNYGSAATLKVSYEGRGDQEERLESTIYLLQGSTRGGRFWRVWQEGTTSGATVEALF